MPHVICEPCIDVKNGICAEVCPVACIHDAADQKVIDPVECIDCGACAVACPVRAIYFIDRVPEKWQAYIAKNANWKKYTISAVCKELSTS